MPSDSGIESGMADYHFTNISDGFMQIEATP